MGNTDAYQTAFAVNPCLTSCAVEPSKTFVAEHDCPLDDPSECICANVTASIELRNSMTAFCFDHCDGNAGSIVTPILKQYCKCNSARMTVQDSAFNSVTLTTTFTHSETSKSYTTIMTMTASVTPTTISTPPPEKAKDSTLGLGLGIGIPAVILAALTLYLTMHIRLKPNSTIAIKLKEFRIHR
jgi:hypothetical protein